MHTASLPETHKDDAAAQSDVCDYKVEFIHGMIAQIMQYDMLTIILENFWGVVEKAQTPGGAISKSILLLAIAFFYNVTSC